MSNPVKINTKQEVIFLLCKYVNHMTGKLEDFRRSKIIQTVNKLNPDTLKTDTKTLVLALYDVVMSNEPKKEQFDIHDTMRQMILHDKEKPKKQVVNDGIRINTQVPGSYEYKYLAVHSDYRDTAQENTSSIKKFTWKYSSTQYMRTGFCNSVGEINNVIGMRMYQPRVPYVAAMGSTSKRVGVLIEEFKSQAFIMTGGNRCHFILRPSGLSGSTIELTTEDYNDGIFTFRTPIKTFDTITISFYDPVNLITFTTPFVSFFIAFEFICIV